MYPVSFQSWLTQFELSGWILRSSRGWSSGETLGKVCSLLQLDSNCPFCLSLNQHQHSWVNNQLSPRWPMVFGYGILVDSTSTTQFIILSNPFPLTNLFTFTLLLLVCTSLQYHGIKMFKSKVLIHLAKISYFLCILRKGLHRILPWWVG